MKKRTGLWFVVCIIVLSLLGGCGRNDGDRERSEIPKQDSKEAAVDEPSAKSPKTATSDKPKKQESEEPEEEKEPDEPEGAIHVSTTEDFLNAIKSDAYIILDEGQYNLSKAFDDAVEGDGDFYNENLMFGGYLDEDSSSRGYIDAEVALDHVNNLTIVGAKDGTTEIVTEDPYLAVLGFVSCDNVTVSNITMGHIAEKGMCCGAVVLLDDCTNMIFSEDDLYGCGTYGFDGYFCTGLRVNDCTIRDCSYGIITLSCCSDTEFNNCIMKNCEEYNLLDVFDSRVIFNSCEFKDNRSEYGFMVDGVGAAMEFRGCSFGKSETQMINDIQGGHNSCYFDENCKFEGNYIRPTITVSDARELLAAIRPGVTICLEPGTYNLSEAIIDIVNAVGDPWDSHRYVEFAEVFDGYEVVLNEVDDLTICGLGKSRGDVEIQIEPRYAAVFRLFSCNNVSFVNLTAGHTDRGTCVGDVISIDGGCGFTFSNVDLYGCGVYGIGAYEACQDINVFDSIIRDCEYGPFWIEDSVSGEINVLNSELTGSNDGGYYGEGDYRIFLARCDFGNQESLQLFCYDKNDEKFWIERCHYSEYVDYDSYEYMID